MINNMDATFANANHLPGVLDRLLPVVGPGLLISIGYVDPGKWAATVDGGARFGFDLVMPMLIFNLAAILFQYIAARIGVVTGRDLAQICSDEYDKCTCMFLGVQTALSVIVLDLTMILGIAHGLNLLFGVDLCTCVFLAAVDAVLFPLFASLLERCKANLLCTFIAGFILLFYFLGVLVSQPEIPLSTNLMLTKLSEESVFALMSLLGANIMPLNFYLHSSAVLRYQGPPTVSKSALCHYHFLAILCIFSGIYLVNYVLMNSAANVFYSSGLVLVTFPDALSLMEQVFRSSVVPLAFLLTLYLTSQITSYTWSLGGQVVLHDFLRLDIPNWLQRATVRIIGIVPALFCVWTSGVEGIYQLLIFTQVLVALLLPSSVIPLFRIASSRPIMGGYKISQLLEFLMLVTFMGMLGLKVLFLVEMIFGDSDWIANLRWNIGSSSSVPHIVLLITACTSFCLMLWLGATPLKSATQVDAQLWNSDVPNPTPKLSMPEVENFFSETRYNREEPIQMQEELLSSRRSIESNSDITVTNADLPETIIDSDKELYLTTIEENLSDVTIPGSLVKHQDESASTMESVSMPTAAVEVADGDLLDAKTVEIEPVDLVERPVGEDGGFQTEKEDDDGDTWDPEESSKGLSGSSLSMSSDGPPSLRSLSGKSDECGNGPGSLSRLGGLGRTARRNLCVILGAFWDQLYDRHGQASEEAKTNKFDVLLVDSKLAFPSLKLESNGMESSGYFPSVGGRASDSLMNSILCDSSKLRVQNNTNSTYGVQKGSPLVWSNHIQLLDAYVQGSSHNVVDPAERRYSSVRSLPSSECRDNQPATIHGYQFASIANRIANDRSSSSLNRQLESQAPISPSLAPRNYREPIGFSLGQNLQSGLISPQSSGFQNFAVSRNSPLQSERPYYDGSYGSVHNGGMQVNTKKYHSLPDISGSGPYRDIYMPEKSTQWGNSAGFGSSVGKTSYDPSIYSSNGSGAGGPLASDDLPKGYGDAFSFRVASNAGSLWSKQPFEQFGVGDKSRAVGSGVGSRLSSITRDATSLVDKEAQLLQYLRCCIVDLLKLEGSDWLFGQSGGADEDLIDRVAARERYLYEAETREINLVVLMGEPQYAFSDKKFGSALKNNEAGMAGTLVSSVPNCGEGCVWRVDLIISFGVWCIHRILDLSLVESRPELWGKYTYVLNRLQGIINSAFSTPRSPVPPCFCLQISSAQHASSPPASNGMLAPVAKPSRGKCTTAGMLLDLIKDVEVAVSRRKGRSGTAAGDVAFPMGKENLASVLKRYKRRLSNKSVGSK